MNLIWTEDCQCKVGWCVPRQSTRREWSELLSYNYLNKHSDLYQLHVYELKTYKHD